MKTTLKIEIETPDEFMAVSEEEISLDKEKQHPYNIANDLHKTTINVVKKALSEEGDLLEQAFDNGDFDDVYLEGMDGIIDYKIQLKIID